MLITLLDNRITGSALILPQSDSSESPFQHFSLEVATTAWNSVLGRKESQLLERLETVALFKYRYDVWNLYYFQVNFNWFCGSSET